jgi:hypothetical protein
MSEDKKGLLHKIGFWLSIVAIIMGIITTAVGNMLGVWIIGFAAYGAYSSYKKVKAINERKHT